MVKLDDLPLFKRSVQNTCGMTTLSENDDAAALHDIQKVLLPLSFVKSDAARLRNTASTPNFSRILAVQRRPYKRAHTSPTVMLPSNGPSEGACTHETSGVKRWDPKSRDASAWDGLRRDEELWSANGDCSVHLYSQGKSRRRPSLQISSSLLVAAGCNQMFKECTGPTGGLKRPDSFTPSVNSSSASCPSDSEKYDLYLPAPEDATRSEAFRWHIATRNFFAWLQDAPLVGVDLGEALIDLLDRMNHYRPNADNTGDLLSYARRIGYLNFVCCPEYALAALRLAEQYRLGDLWIESFAHCVGMNESLRDNAAYEATSRVTKALISRAYLEMDLHLGRVSRALTSFLEEELSPANFGLSAGAQSHLDRFRTFLHSHYIEEYGYWPPQQGVVLGKPLLRRMTAEFTNLYSFLVDTGSSNSMQDQNRPADGGICVLQNLNAFNERHNYEPLPHPLPLLPKYDRPTSKVDSQRGFRAFKLGRRDSKVDQRTTKHIAIMQATNSDKPELYQTSLINDYIRFEREWSSRPEEKVSLADARKVRWIAIYCILQMLKSVTRAPKQVANPDAAPYHLCLLTAGTPPWCPTGGVETEALTKTTSTVAKHQSDQSLLSFIADSGAISLVIEPDCDLEDVLPKPQSVKEPSLRPAPLRIITGDLARSSSLNIFGKPKSPSRTSSNKTSPIPPASRDFADEIQSPGLSSTAIQASSESNPHNGTVLPQQTFRPVSTPPTGTETVDPVTPVHSPALDAFIFQTPGTQSSESDTDDSYTSPRSYRSSKSSAASSSAHSWRLDDSEDALSATDCDELHTPSTPFSKNVYSIGLENTTSSSPSKKNSFSGLDFWTRRTSQFPSQDDVRGGRLGPMDEEDREEGEEYESCDEVHAPFESCVDIYRAMDLLPLYIPEQRADA